MKMVSKDNAILRKNSELCLVSEYPLGDQDIDFAIITLKGRYPDRGRITSTRSKEIVYIHKGEGSVEVEGQKHTLTAGDVVLIEAGEKYYWEGSMTLYISCHPAFTIEHHQQVA